MMGIENAYDAQRWRIKPTKDVRVFWKEELFQETFLPKLKQKMEMNTKSQYHTTILPQKGCWSSAIIYSEIQVYNQPTAERYK